VSYLFVPEVTIPGASLRISARCPDGGQSIPFLGGFPQSAPRRDPDPVSGEESGRNGV